MLVLGGGATALLAVCHGLLDNRARLPVLARPLAILGANALAVYVVASFLASTLRHVKVHDAQGLAVSLQAYCHQALFSAWPDPRLASLAWATLFLGAMFLLAWALYARRIVIRL